MKETQKNKTNAQTTANFFRSTKTPQFLNISAGKACRGTFNIQTVATEQKQSYKEIKSEKNPTNPRKILTNSENLINSYLKNIINYNLLKEPITKDAKTASVWFITKRKSKKYRK